MKLAMWMETDQDTAMLKTYEAEKLRVDAIVTLCPSCLQNLIKSKSKIKVMM